MNVHYLTQYGTQDRKFIKLVVHGLQQILLSETHFPLSLVVTLTIGSTPPNGLLQGSYELTCNPTRCKFSLSFPSNKVGQPVLMDCIDLQEECDSWFWHSLTLRDA